MKTLKNIFGFYNDEIINEETYEVGNICILPEYQGKGIGTNILKTKIEEHKHQDIIIQYLIIHFQ